MFLPWKHWRRLKENSAKLDIDISEYSEQAVADSLAAPAAAAGAGTKEQPEDEKPGDAGHGSTGPKVETPADPLFAEVTKPADKPETPAAAQAAPAAAATPAPPTPALPGAPIRQLTIDGVPFAIFSDGSIEAELAGGNKRFATLAEARAYFKDGQNAGAQV